MELKMYVAPADETYLKRHQNNGSRWKTTSDGEHLFQLQQVLHHVVQNAPSPLKIAVLK